MMSDITAKHRALIVLYAEIHQVHLDGQCSGDPVYKHKITLTLDGSDRLMIERKLHELIQEIRTKCQS